MGRIEYFYGLHNHTTITFKKIKRWQKKLRRKFSLQKALYNRHKVHSDKRKTFIHLNIMQRKQ